jgi:hypothetical protein
VGQHDAVARPQRHQERGAHAVEAPIFHRLDVDALVGVQDGRVDQTLRAVVEGGDLPGELEVGPPRHLGEERHEVLDGQPAGDFARVVAAHAVGQHVQLVRLVDGVEVFVGRALAPHVGPAEGAQGQRAGGCGRPTQRRP